MNLEKLVKLNKDILIKDVEDKSFIEYGKVLSDLDFTSLVKYAEGNCLIPKDGNKYLASVKDIENFEVIDVIRDGVYGQLDIEAGLCAGQNTALTGLEYHQGSEVTIAVTDCVLIVGKVQHMYNNSYDACKAEAFYVNKGQAIELYGTTLHYTPCKVEKNGFMTIVVLLRGTNMPIESTDNRILTKKNKFFIAHESQEEKISSGAYPGLIGEMLNIKIE